MNRRRAIIFVRAALEDLAILLGVVTSSECARAMAER
jgi:hypothetical protein